MTFYPLESIHNLHDSFRKTVVINDLDLMLLQHQGKVYLLESICPHAGYPLDESKLIGTALRCPMHGYLFEIADGRCTANFEGPCRGLHTYDVVYQGDEVGVVL